MDEAIKIQEKKALYWLCRLPGMDLSVIRKLWEQYHSFVRLYNIEETDLQPQLASRLQDWLPHRLECENHYEEMLQRGIRFITILDEEYPAGLRTLYDYPVALYVKGRLPDPKLPSIAIVGARSCSSYGKQLAEFFARVLSEEGIQVISGLAMGIDGAAHQGAVKAGKPTYAVLGCGVNICYPSCNYQLYEAILPQGGIISEYGLDEKPKTFHFPLRNRIISALSDGILVIEAKEKSGSLITAELGLEQGKEIFSIPGRITDPLSKGCNLLIRQGAEMVISPENILESFSIKRQKKLIICEKNINRLANKEKMVYSCLDFKPKHLDFIAERCGLNISECLEVLLILEISGYVIQTANHYYEKKL
ncbi:MAG: DNA-processing protein DprA [Lachnospiraceae bacterium]